MKFKYLAMFTLFAGLFCIVDNNISDQLEYPFFKKNLSQKNEVIQVPIEHGIYYSDSSCGFNVNDNYNESLKSTYPAFYEFDIKNYFNELYGDFLFITKDTTMNIFHKDLDRNCYYSYEKINISENTSPYMYSYEEDTMEISILENSEYVVTYNDEKIIKYKIEGKSEQTNGTLRVNEYENGVVTSYEGMEIVLLENSYIFN